MNSECVAHSVQVSAVIKSRSIYLRNRMIANLEAADFECFPNQRQSLLTFVVAGGGFAGVETIASMNDFLRSVIRFYPHLSEKMLHVVLVHPGSVILPELGEKLGHYAQKKLAERKVEIRVNTKVDGVFENGVKLSDGTIIESDTLVWTAGTSPHPLLQSLPCKSEKGRILVNEYMEVPDWPGVWALGDCALVPDRSYRPCGSTDFQTGDSRGNFLTKCSAGNSRGKDAGRQHLPGSCEEHPWCSLDRTTEISGGRNAAARCAQDFIRQRERNQTTPHHPATDH